MSNTLFLQADLNGVPITDLAERALENYSEKLSTTLIIESQLVAAAHVEALRQEAAFHRIHAVAERIFSSISKDVAVVYGVTPNASTSFIDGMAARLSGQSAPVSQLVAAESATHTLRAMYDSGYLMDGFNEFLDAKVAALQG